MVKKIACAIGWVVLGLGAAAAAVSAGEPRCITRGVVITPEDLSWTAWLERAQRAGLTTVSLHDGASPKRIAEFIGSAAGRKFLDGCRARGLQVEYELHAMRELLPRDLFAKEPGLFRMDENGQRTPDSNLCVHSEKALETAGRRALEIARVLRPTTHRYFYWGDDGQPWCRCPACAPFSESDQALILENSLLTALRREDPEARLAHLAYANTLRPPKAVKPAPGIFLEFAPIERRYDVPLSDAGDSKSRGALAALDGNLSVFGARDAQVLEYWLDASRFSGWKRPSVNIPFNAKVFQADLDAYTARGLRHITSFAVFIDADYISRHGEPPLEAYGAGLLGASH